MIQSIFIFINSPGDPFTEGFFFMEMGGIYYSICKGIGVLKAEEEESEEPQKAAQREQVESPALSRPRPGNSKASSSPQKGASSEKCA